MAVGTRERADWLRDAPMAGGDSPGTVRSNENFPERMVALVSGEQLMPVGLAAAD